MEVASAEPRVHLGEPKECDILDSIATPPGNLCTAICPQTSAWNRDDVKDNAGLASVRGAVFGADLEPMQATLAPLSPVNDDLMKSCYREKIG